jgi:hypothetical protein
MKKVKIIFMVFVVTSGIVHAQLPQRPNCDIREYIYSILCQPYTLSRIGDTIYRPVILSHDLEREFNLRDTMIEALNAPGRNTALNNHIFYKIAFVQQRYDFSVTQPVIVKQKDLKILESRITKLAKDSNIVIYEFLMGSIQPGGYNSQRTFTSWSRKYRRIYYIDVWIQKYLFMDGRKVIKVL